MQEPQRERPEHWNPVAPTEDYIPLAWASMGFGILLGTALVAAVLLGVRALIAQAPPTDNPDPTQPAGILLIFGTLAACATAALGCWTALAPVPTYRRGGLSMVTGFATIMMALLLAPVNELGGPIGLGVVAVACGALAWRLSKRIQRVRAGQ
ncbi:MAG: hypothetical protein E4H41_03025 [Gemmatimonadales bacterium]|jgi:hypothetical protein|nr:MAG: hypothetical protein E4H41_03025 [Gemmatimonadales bacterium]